MKSTAALPRARKDGLVIKELPGETLVYDLERDEAHCLNQTAALVWKGCDGKTTVARMAGLLQDQLDTSVNADVVWLAIKQLQRFHLVENERETVATPSVSRRNLVLKYAPAALVLPVIMSISAPAAAQAATCVQPGGNCSAGQNCCAGSSCANSVTCCLPLGFTCSSDNDCCSTNCDATTSTCQQTLRANPK
jgi:hypothetical protein